MIENFVSFALTEPRADVTNLLSRCIQDKSWILIMALCMGCVSFTSSSCGFSFSFGSSTVAKLNFSDIGSNHSRKKTLLKKGCRNIDI